MNPPATVVIVTRDRKEELACAIQSVVEQTARSEVIVIDDGSTDGTAEFVRARWPEVRLVRHIGSKGCVVRRNEGMRIASSEIVFSMDDDAAFSTNRVIEQTLREFTSARVGAVAIPLIDVKRDSRVQQLAPDSSCDYVTSAFMGGAHAIRKSVFLGLGGYREHLVHQGEEGDFCIRLLNAGYVVRLGTADPINHFESPKRDFSRMDYYGARNAILFAWQNVPLPFVLIHLPVTTIRCLLLTLRPNRFMTRLSGVVQGYLHCSRRRREPVSRSAYLLVRALRRKGPQRLADLDLPTGVSR